jgi:hypothetical protein
LTFSQVSGTIDPSGAQKGEIRVGKVTTMNARPKFDIETVYINEVIASGIYSLTVTRKAATEMRAAETNLADVTYVLMHGRVVRSDMLEMRGLWDVRGKTVDGAVLELTVAVISVEHNLELLEVLLVKKEG